MQYGAIATAKHPPRSISAEDYEQARLLVAAKSRAINTGRKLSAETAAKIGAALTGRQHSETTKLKISVAHTGKIVSKETCEKISKARKGKPGRTWTEDARKALSNKHTGVGNPMHGQNIKNFMTEDAYASYKQNLSKALIGHEVSEETRKKLAAAGSRRFSGGGNPKAKRVLCVEDGLVFETLTECGAYYGQARHKMTKIAKNGYSAELDKTFRIISS